MPNTARPNTATPNTAGEPTIPPQGTLDISAEYATRFAAYTHGSPPAADLPFTTGQVIGLSIRVVNKATGAASQPVTYRLRVTA